jgi:hypothetical protein
MIEIYFVSDNFITLAHKLCSIMRPWLGHSNNMKEGFPKKRKVKQF